MNRFSDISPVVAALIIGTLTGLVPLVLPGLVEVLKHGYGFDDVKLGYLASADLAGMTLGAVLGANLASRLGFRRCTQAGLLMALGANSLGIICSTYLPLLTIRFIAGFGVGLTVPTCYRLLGQGPQVDRNFSGYLIAQTLTGAAIIRWIPSLAEQWGISAVFTLLAAMLVAALPFTRRLPSKHGHSSGSSASVRLGPAAWMGLAAVLMYFAAQAGVWTYIELIGENGGLSRSTVANVLASSMLIGLAGPIFAAVLSARFGRAIPSLVGLCGNFGALYLLHTFHSSYSFIWAVCLFSVAWNFVIPYQFASVAAVDLSGRSIGWAAPISVAGYALGPIMGALALRIDQFDGVLGLSAVLCVLSFVALVPAWISSAAARRANGDSSLRHGLSAEGQDG